VSADSFDRAYTALTASQDVVLVDLPTGPESYAFSVPLTSIYSLIVTPPSLSSWRQSLSSLTHPPGLIHGADGTVGINLISGSTLPTLYFHDDESRSFTSPASPAPASAQYPPAPAPAPASWGGEDLLSRLRAHAHILRSALQPTLHLLDPSRADIEAHSTQLFDDDAVDAILAQSAFPNGHSPIPAHRRPRPLSAAGAPAGAGAGAGAAPRAPNPYSQRSSLLHRSLPPAAAMGGGGAPSQARAALLQSFGSITRATRHAAQSVLSHPLARPIVPHLPDPVRSFVTAPGEWGSWVESAGAGEFEAARVYLARWARVVAEEGARARRTEAAADPASPAGAEEGALGVFELLHAAGKNLPAPKTSRDPRRPVNELDWEKWFGEAPDDKGKGKAKESDAAGRPTVRVEEMRREVFRRGIASQGTLRQRLWPLVLGVSEWDATDAERAQDWAEKR
jgi:hypothetical protein